MVTIDKLKFWCYKILPLVYDDSLSYYEVICKTTQKLNEVIGNINNIPEYINEEIAKQLGDDDLLLKLFNKITNAIVTTVDSDEFTQTEKFGGEVFWHNGELVECIKHMDVGTKYISDENIKNVNIIELINDVRNFISKHDEKYNERASRTINKGEFLFWKDTFVKASENIAEDTLLTNDLLVEVSIGDELKLESDTRASDITRVDKKINDNTTILQKQITDNTTALQKQITDNTTALREQITANANELREEITSGDTSLQEKLDQYKNNTDTSINNLSTYGTPEMYGAIGDGVADDTDAINQCLNNHKIVKCYKKYRVTNTINIGSNTYFEFDTLINNTNDNAVININGTYSRIVGNLITGTTGITVGGDKVTLNITIDVLGINADNCLVIGAIKGVQELHIYNIKFYYKNVAIKLDTSNSYVGELNFIGCEFTYNGNTSAGTQVYAVTANTTGHNGNVTGLSFINCSAEGSRGFLYAEGDGGEKGLEHLYIYGLRTAELAVSQKYKVIKLKGDLTIRGEMLFDKAYFNSFDLTEFTNLYCDFKIKGTLYYDDHNPSLAAQCATEASFAFKSLRITEFFEKTMFPGTDSILRSNTLRITQDSSVILPDNVWPNCPIYIYNLGTDAHTITLMGKPYLIEAGCNITCNFAMPASVFNDYEKQIYLTKSNIYTFNGNHAGVLQKLNSMGNGNCMIYCVDNTDKSKYYMALVHKENSTANNGTATCTITKINSTVGNLYVNNNGSITSDTLIENGTYLSTIL